MTGAAGPPRKGEVGKGAAEASMREIGVAERPGLGLVSRQSRGVRGCAGLFSRHPFMHGPSLCFGCRWAGLCRGPARSRPGRPRPVTSRLNTTRRRDSSAVTAAPADPVVAAIRAKLADPAIRKGANADDLAALEAFYAARTGALVDHRDGLLGEGAGGDVRDRQGGRLGPRRRRLRPAARRARCRRARRRKPLAEIKLDLAILKYARFARGGRFNPPELSDLFDQAPPLRDPKTVLAEIAAADAPDAYLQLAASQARAVRAPAPGAAQGARQDDDGGKPAGNERDIKRLVINMERWRWMPEDLGAVYVWNNSPEFMLYVVKDGKPIYADKTLVGTIAYATPVFTADMKTIVFNPDWIAPRDGRHGKPAAALARGKLLDPQDSQALGELQRHSGRPDAGSIGAASIFSITPSARRRDPSNVLGKVKFLFPNRHTVYMHDTLPVRKKYFQKPVRAIGHECVRMEKPQRFAEVLLAEDKGWPASQVKELWDKGVNSPVTIDRKIPGAHGLFHGGGGRDGQGLDLCRRLRARQQARRRAVRQRQGLSRAAAGQPSGRQTEEADASPGRARRTATGSNDIAGSLGGFVGD